MRSTRRAYKQEDGVAYHARDMAVVRARLEGATIVLASATPSIETRVNAASGRYAHLRLTARAGARPMPRIEAIDMRKRRAAARTLDRAAPRAARRPRPSRAASRRCSSSIGAAMRR